ncbi:MAG: hypothetical protein N2652_03675 [Kiritimatiellae bacterium]|nr:hypothetical protein [Kiritimatiellia bacterium]
MMAAVIALLMAAMDGCNSGGGGTGGSPGSAGIDLSGTWQGQYVAPGVEIPLSAKIRQSGDSIIIQTTKDGVGHLLTGVMRADGSLLLTDSFDGETWTSYGPVTESYVRIRDYLYDPSLGSDSPEQDIYLSRAR